MNRRMKYRMKLHSTENFFRAATENVSKNENWNEISFHGELLFRMKKWALGRLPGMSGAALEKVTEHVMFYFAASANIL